MKISQGRRGGRGGRRCRRRDRIHRCFMLYIRPCKGRAGRSLGRRKPAVRCRTCVPPQAAPRISFLILHFSFLIAPEWAPQPVAAPGRRAASSRCSKASPSARLQAFSHRINRAAIGGPQPPGGGGPQFVAERVTSAGCAPNINFGFAAPARMHSSPQLLFVAECLMSSSVAQRPAARSRPRAEGCSLWSQAHPLGCGLFRTGSIASASPLACLLRKLRPVSPVRIFLENRKICLFLSFRFGRSCLLQQP